MKSILVFIIVFIGLTACSFKGDSSEKETSDASPVTGRLESIEAFESKYVDPRNIDIWFPPSYKKEDSRRYPVIYMHDGQVLFQKGRGFSGEEWEVDEMMTNLISEDKVQEAIIVGIWNTNKRFREYQPNKPFQNLNAEQQVLRDSLDADYNGGPLADEYLKSIVEELKPFLDTNYKTLADKENTYMMGSSMGGLISIYAMAEYPHVFKSVACLSSHFPISLKQNSAIITHQIIDYLRDNLPDGTSNRIYFDYGTKTLDTWYEPHQQYMDSMMVQLGYTENLNWVTRKFEGAEHSEISWKERLDVPLMFLIGK